MNATTTHYLSKEEVSEKLQSLHYNYQESYWESFVESQSANRFSSPKAPTTKLSPKLLAIPLSLIIVSGIIYFSITNLRSQNKTGDSLNNKVEAASLPADNSQTKQIANDKKNNPETNTPTNPVTSVSKKDVSTAPATIAIKPEATPTKKEEAKTSAITTNSLSKTSNNTNSTARTIAPEQPAVKQTTVASQENKENSIIKKKKKRRKHDNADSENVFVPSPEDDNVVVPSN